jgi:DNA primase
VPASWVSFDDVKAQVSVVDVLQRYNLFDALQQKGFQLVGLCPFHNDSTPSFKVTPERNIWRCFGCQKGGDVIDLVCAFERIATGHRTSNRRQATLLLAEWFGVASARPPRKTSHTCAAAVDDRASAHLEEGNEDGAHESNGDQSEVINPPLGFELKNLDSSHPYLQHRGLTEETIATFGIGYFAGRGSMHGRIVIPIHDEQGALVAYAGRWPGKEGWPEGEDKYKLPAHFHKSRVLYNLHRITRDHASEGLIVVEGFFTVFELWQKGRRNVVAVMGSTISKVQEHLIVETVGPKGRVLLAFDPDEAGRTGSADAVRRLAPQVFVRTIELVQ